MGFLDLKFIGGLAGGGGDSDITEVVNANAILVDSLEDVLDGIADPELIPNNIKKDVTIYGVTGNLESIPSAWRNHITSTAKSAIEVGEPVVLYDFKGINGSDEITRYPSLSISPSNSANDCAFSEDGNYYAVAHASAPFITIYKNNEGTFEKLSNPTVLPSGEATCCSFSPNGDYLAVGHSSAPYITIYELQEDGITFTKLANPEDLPTASIYSCAFSADGQYLALGAASLPYLMIYYVSNNTDTFTKVTAIDTLPGSRCYALSFSPDNTKLVVGQNDDPYIALYNISEGGVFSVSTAFESLSNEGLVRGVSFSSDSLYFCTANNNAPFMTVYHYDVSDSIFKKLAAPETTPTGVGYGCEFSKEGLTLAISHNNYPCVSFYKITSGSTVTKMQNVSDALVKSSSGCAFDGSGKYFSATSKEMPYLAIYPMEDESIVEVVTPCTTSDISAFNGYGIATESVSANSVVGVDVLTPLNQNLKGVTA